MSSGRSASLYTVNLDCADPRAMVGFYSAFLGWERCPSSRCPMLQAIRPCSHPRVGERLGRCFIGDADDRGDLVEAYRGFVDELRMCPSAAPVRDSSTARSEHRTTSA